MRTDQTFTTRGEEVVVAVSLELAAAKWKVALHDGRREKPAVHTVAQPQAAARLQAVLDLIEAHRQKWSLPAGARVVVSYEAGQGLAQECRALPAPVHPALLAAALGDRRDARVLLQFISALETVTLLAECSQQARRQMRTCSGQAK